MEGSDLCWLGWAQKEECFQGKAAGRGEASLEPGVGREAGP